jgi:hypothetical protein
MLRAVVDVVLDGVSHVTVVDPEPVAGTSLRPIHITGNGLSVSNAYVHISTFLRGKDRDEAADADTTITMTIHDDFVARTIGRGGCHVRKMEDMTGLAFLCRCGLTH